VVDKITSGFNLSDPDDRLLRSTEKLFTRISDTFEYDIEPGDECVKLVWFALTGEVYFDVELRGKLTEVVSGCLENV